MISSIAEKYEGARNDTHGSPLPMVTICAPYARMIVTVPRLGAVRFKNLTDWVWLGEFVAHGHGRGRGGIFCLGGIRVSKRVEARGEKCNALSYSSSPPSKRPRHRKTQLQAILDMPTFDAVIEKTLEAR